jgi:hypothetical protein
MADVTETRILPPEFIEAAGKNYLSDLSTATGDYKTADLSKVFGPQFVAGLDPLQQQAQGLATAGVGSYQPYLSTAAAHQAAAAGYTGQAAADQATAAGYAAPGAYTQFQSPYQQDVIKATMDDYDIQAAKGLPALRAKAMGAGAFGGGREGVQLAEYQATSDKNRASLLAQLNQQGFNQAQDLRQQALQNQMNLSNAQLGLGQSELGLGQGQLGLAGSQAGFLGQDVGALSTLGAMNQQQQQQTLGAQQQLAQQKLNQPMTAAQNYGTGVTQLIAGYPGQTTQMSQPSANPLMTAIGAGGTLAGIYGAMTGKFNAKPLLSKQF